MEIETIMDKMKLYYHETKTEEKHKIYFIEIDPSLFVAKVEKIVTIFDSENKKIKTIKSSKQGIVSKSQKDNILNAQEYHIKKCFLLSDEYIQETKKSHHDLVKKMFSKNKNHFSEKIYDDIISEKFTIENIYYHDINFNFKDYKGNTISHPIEFNFIDGDISHKNFDIPKLAEYLLKKSNIIFSLNRYDTKPSTKEDIIQNLKNFPRKGQEIQTINFYWLPSDIEFDLFYQRAKSLYQEDFYSHIYKIIHDMDLLGFKKNNLIINKDYNGSYDQNI